MHSVIQTVNSVAGKGMCFTVELVQDAAGFLKEANSLVSLQPFEKWHGKKQFSLTEEPYSALEIEILK